jgi:hypothetical protein
MNIETAKQNFEAAGRALLDFLTAEENDRIAKLNKYVCVDSRYNVPWVFVDDGTGERAYYGNFTDLAKSVGTPVIYRVKLKTKRGKKR